MQNDAPNSGATNDLTLPTNPLYCRVGDGRRMWLSSAPIAHPLMRNDG